MVYIRQHVQRTWPPLIVQEGNQGFADTKFADYVPRKEPPSGHAGGKVVKGVLRDRDPGAR